MNENELKLQLYANNRSAYKILLGEFTKIRNKVTNLECQVEGLKDGLDNKGKEIYWISGTIVVFINFVFFLFGKVGTTQ